MSEAIDPDVSAVDPSRLAMGEPDAPRSFVWRGAQYEIAEVLSTWRTYRMDRGDKYVDRHWFDVQAKSGERMRIYCERRIRTFKRWWLFSID